MLHILLSIHSSGDLKLVQGLWVDIWDVVHGLCCRRFDDTNHEAEKKDCIVHYQVCRGLPSVPLQPITTVSWALGADLGLQIAGCFCVLPCRVLHHFSLQ